MIKKDVQDRLKFYGGFSSSRAPHGVAWVRGWDDGKASWQLGESDSMSPGWDSPTLALWYPIYLCISLHCTILTGWRLVWCQLVNDCKALTVLAEKKLVCPARFGACWIQAYVQWHDSKHSKVCLLSCREQGFTEPSRLGKTIGWGLHRSEMVQR